MSQIWSLDNTRPNIALPHSPEDDQPVSLLKLSNILGITNPSKGAWVEKLPFAGDDITAGSESELQATVLGDRGDVDLPLSIESSSYYKNMAKRAISGDMPRRNLVQLQNYLNGSKGIWENSWVRFPLHLLNAFALRIWNFDLRSDKSLRDSPQRKDASGFECLKDDTVYLRTPISYLLKLSLAQVLGQTDVPGAVRQAGRRMLACFINDNTSPETHSMNPVGPEGDRTIGQAISHETLRRYLLSQLLAQFANRAFELEDNGQKAQVYFCPHPPVRQKQLNDLISDTFYRNLFISPCLSGWDKGEEKQQYMALCHTALSRSQLNTLAKLKESGIISRNLVVMPNLSNICLANNSIHISFGSRRLTEIMRQGGDFRPIDEKYYGDLVIKIVEHFLPLFVGTYSASPYRFDFQDFHPEKVLGFLPHEIDYTHLRMLWRRWKQKADIKLFNNPVTPFGPEWLDKTFGRIMGLKGDWVPDYRLIDYLVCVLSTDESPALNGRPGSDSQLKEDLAAMGVFDPHMPLYLLYRLRQYQQIGFTGFEGRYYSLFERFGQDMTHAIDLQHLVTLLAYKYILQGWLTHSGIPDNPTVESERRYTFFGSAIGIPTFYIQKNSPNRLMNRIVGRAQLTRSSRRYPGYIRIPDVEYRRALIRLIKQDGEDLIDMLNLQQTISDLEARLENPEEHTAAFRISRRILGRRKSSPLKMPANEFNHAVEDFYRRTLKQEHIKEAFAFFREEIGDLDSWEAWRSGTYNKALLKILDGRGAVEYIDRVERDVLTESLPAEDCAKLIQLILLVYHQQSKKRTG